jgi:hypothetical protein
MNIRVRVTPNSKIPVMIRIDESNYGVKVNAPATKGRANERLVEMLADHFGVSKSSIRILKGLNGRNKLVRIGE